MPWLGHNVIWLYHNNFSILLLFLVHHHFIIVNGLSELKRCFLRDKNFDPLFLKVLFATVNSKNDKNLPFWQENVTRVYLCTPKQGSPYTAFNSFPLNMHSFLLLHASLAVAVTSRLNAHVWGPLHSLPPSKRPNIAFDTLITLPSGHNRLPSSTYSDSQIIATSSAKI